MACLGVLLCSLSTGYAQTKCESGSCVNNFSKAQEGFWPDWVEVSPVEINYISVAKGAGLINVESHGPDYYQDNHAHLWWAASGEGWSEISATVRFSGDNGRAGWIEKFVGGQQKPEQNCHPLERAPRVSDETLILALYDDGQGYIGVFLGDLLPLGMNIAPKATQPPGPFGVLGIVQLMPGETAPRVLSYAVGEAIKMQGKPLDLALSVSPSWEVTATGTLTHKGDVYQVRAQAAPPNVKGGVGVIGVTGARPRCIYRAGGEFNRQFELSWVQVR
jgi:hypothetical protein